MTRKELFEKWDSRIDAVENSPYNFFKLIGMELPPEDARALLVAMRGDPFYAMKAGIALGAEWQEQQFTTKTNVQAEQGKGATP